MIALACVKREQSAIGTTLAIEMTVEAVRRTVSAKVVATPFLIRGGRPQFLSCKGSFPLLDDKCVGVNVVAKQS